ncbi:Rad17 cell cycle checkpoint protein-domain-containing protein [Coprinopsis sp. MPI-PUGE-AT-0042]|nr:Rad17 cell cycle checkpoint protein-domain-containing protein [Coprinopsis sp. MPI-PUGE-AT-0042]
MPPKASASSSQPAKRPVKAKINVVKLGGSSTQPLPGANGAEIKRFDPLSGGSASPPSSQDGGKRPSVAGTKLKSSQTSVKKAKAKNSARQQSHHQGGGLTVELDDRLWVDLHEPTSEAELAVHVRKVEDVRRWLSEAFDGGPTAKLKKYRRILAMTGPAGTGKTSTLRVLAREMDFEIIEWKNSIGEATTIYHRNFMSSSSSSPFGDYDPDSESLFTKFETFFNRAARCSNLTFSNKGKARAQPKRQLVLLEDLPNILHSKVQSSFHDCLRALVESTLSDPPVPVVIIISDTGLRGEARDERIAGGGGWGKERDQVVDILFNPIAPTLMRKALQTMIQSQTLQGDEDFVPPSKQALDVVIESSNGDIRSAIMALQFACLVPGHAQSNQGNGRRGVVPEAITRREQSLALFHLIGKVLYNKRKSQRRPIKRIRVAKDMQKEREIDAQLKDPTRLPSWLEHEERRTSRVDVDAIYADSPIDSSLFSLYIHQNFQQFCNETEEIENVADWLSWVDSSGGEAWYQANPHQFHLITLGTLHSLPSPVQRRSQKIFKPEFFDLLQKEKDARDAVRLTRDSPKFTKGSPATGSKSAMVGEKDGVGEDEEVVLGLEDDDEVMRRMHGRGAGALGEEGEEGGGWLEGDDIEEWD